MNNTRLLRVFALLLILTGATWVMATNPTHIQADWHHSVFWYGAAGLLASLVLYGLLFTGRSGAAMEKRFAAFFRWVVPSSGLFVTAALMEQDADASKWQNSILVLNYLCVIIGSIGTTPFLFGLIRKR